ncbi:hypothetical protein L227DRAFT_580113 [Lentinus tigrinus ALCF2SS1-6]|uniref:Rieske domain-containing protein n=1 Tax=Lentinus tigrinus ALCF2SS1-6 TaxID=1328759 RepID=A0A5C2RUC0_9APHY|nr:hypothetical protein L227DRAFT_580113 [Lentinus tigrinus ALCF2SS1-6]
MPCLAYRIGVLAASMTTCVANQSHYVECWPGQIWISQDSVRRSFTGTASVRTGWHKALIDGSGRIRALNICPHDAILLGPRGLRLGG